MSGFAVAFGQACREKVTAMLEAIGHRGLAHSGLCQRGRAILAQNYASADLTHARTREQVPFNSPLRDNLSICYDGQIGNWTKLAADCGVEDGPFREERLLLQLYREHGNDML